MAPLTLRNLAVPITAFGMAWIVGGCIYHFIGRAKRNAAIEREIRYDQVLQQRYGLGMDAWDQRKERERLRGEMLRKSGGGGGGGVMAEVEKERGA